ncbi:MAG TPA: hypothetical protein VJ890_12895 [Vineibacter sp.]|nr:hypothetical protein [Vineibacter sp.]
MTLDVDRERLRIEEARFALEERRTQVELRERETELDKKKTWFKEFVSNPVAVTLSGAIVALAGNALVVSISHKNALELERRKSQSELIRSATASGSMNEIAGRMRTLLDFKLIPDYHDAIKAVLNNPANPDPVFPQASPTQEGIGTKSSTDTGRFTGTAGWMYLGKTDKNKTTWVESSAFGQFDRLPDLQVGKAPSELLKGKTIVTKGYKYLRGAGEPGRRVQSPVKVVLNPASSVKIRAIDDTGEDGGLPVVWAEVEVQ